MNDDAYNELLDRIRKMKPRPASGEKLTNEIMKILDKEIPGKQSFLMVRANESQWNIYRGLRTIMAMAAVFLIGFFVYQQGLINQKLNRMERSLIPSDVQDMPVNSQTESQLLQKVLFVYQESPASFPPDSVQTGILQINRKSLNFMLTEIQKLKSENKRFRERLLELYPDSTVINANETMP